MENSTALRNLRTLVNANGFERIGQRVRRLRQQLGLGLRDLAALADVSKNTLLRLEQGQSVHLSTLRSVCRALKVKPGQLVAMEQDSSLIAVHLTDDDKWFDMNTFTHFQQSRQLTPEEIELARNDGEVIPFNIIWARFSNGRFNPNEIMLFHPTRPRSHRGEEFVYVLDGAIEVVLASRTVALQQGESALFYAAEEHHYRPVGEQRPARVLSIVFDPFPALGLPEDE